MTAFEGFDFKTGVIAADLDPAYPTTLHGFEFDDGGGTYEFGGAATFFGYVHRGTATVIQDTYRTEVRAGQYFAVTDAAKIEGVNAAGFLIEAANYRALTQFGGPAEREGRLRYIDGCTDSLLVPPVLKGDPCLNLLYFPEGIDQTAHTHPTVRVGIVASGRGECVADDKVIPLVEGMLFVIRPEGRHKFRTTDSHMRVIAYHPDSDTGPTHDDHPMVNRTMVDGVSAAKIDAIRTQ